LDNITVVLVDVPEDDVSSAEELRHRMDVVRNAPLFSYLNYRELVILMNASYMRTISEGEFITEAGVPGDEILILVKGEARTIVNDVEVTRWPEGSHFGEISLFSSAPRAANVQAISAGRLLVIGREQFYKFVHRESVAGIKLLWRLYQMSQAQKASRDTDRQSRRTNDLAPNWILIED
jgi:CRP-like cAMP-binding protein